MTTKRFVKSAETSTSVVKSQHDLEKILRRYGATGLTLSSDWEARVARVSFRVPDRPVVKGESPPQIVPVRLEVSMQAIAEALGLRVPTQYGWEQTERVAWRHLVLWVDAACSAAGAGLQTMSEAFLAHTLVQAPDGSVKKVSTLLDEVAGEGGYRALLPAGGTT